MQPKLVGPEDSNQAMTRFAQLLDAMPATAWQRYQSRNAVFVPYRQVKIERTLRLVCHGLGGVPEGDERSRGHSALSSRITPACISKQEKLQN